MHLYITGNDCVIDDGLSDLRYKVIAGNCRGKKRNADQPIVSNSQLHLQKRRKTKEHKKENIS